MKRTWQFNGTVSSSKVILRDETKICSECGVYDGHFVECTKLEAIKEKQRTDEQIRLLQEAVNEACRNDTSHTKELSKN